VPDPQTWLLDFDETLATGNLTYAMQHAFPKFMRDHHLQPDQQRLQQVMLDVQKRASKEIDPLPLLKVLVEGMGWAPELTQPLFEALWVVMTPELFPDVMPFLDRLRADGKRVLIVSNSGRTPEQMNLLGLMTLVDGVFTPKTCPDTLPKPHRSLWDYAVMQYADLTPETAVVVGDDPWSDGAFADACGLPCWIVDRNNRYGDVRGQSPYRWVRSLADIPV
jgi:FMN phosphatase YigB (HAD superfamily)